MNLAYSETMGYNGDMQAKSYLGIFWHIVGEGGMIDIHHDMT